MCGITGSFATGRANPDTGWVERACTAMVHRGPDEQHIHADPRVALGVVRLRVLGLTDGAQPVRSTDGSVVAVVNGEIYNHRKLRRDLERRGRPVGGSSDVAVVADLYAEFGADFVDHLDGMFAIALHDARSGELVLATDRAGKKPIHLARTAAGEVVFASELAALATHRGVSREVDPIAIDQYLSYRVVPAPRTVFRDVEKIEPATVVVIDSVGRTRRHRYWDFPFTADLADVADDEMVDQLDDLLTAAVQSRLEADVPLGAMLSGGLDSSLVTALTARMASGRLHTFSVGFDHPGFDESEHALKVANALGTIHHTQRLTAADLADTVDDVLRHVGEPYAFPSAIASWAMYRLAAREVTVVMTGDGSDEIFCGYRRYREFAELDPDTDLADRYEHVLLDGLPRALRRRLYRPGFLPELTNHLRSRFDQTDATVPDLDRAMHVDCRFWLSDAQLVKIDRMAMAHSVEPRSPFLDRRLVEYVARIPAARKLVDGDEKRPLKALARRYLSASIVYRRKQELAVPLEAWLRHGLAPTISETLLSERALDRGYFMPDAVRTLVQECRAEDSYVLWTLFVLERWHRLSESSTADTDRVA